MLTTVRKACQLHEGALTIQVSEAIVRFDELTGDPASGRAFFDTTYLTEGLNALLRGATRRLAGKSSDSSFHLKQAMGGGKTHSITALSYLARHLELRRELLPDLPEARAFEGVRFAAFNGRERPDEFFWGRIIRQLDAAEFLRHDGADAPDESAWVKVFKKFDTPVLIVLDELPPYFEYLNTVTIGAGTMADRAANAFASMLTAAHRLTNVCVVVSDLAGVYGAGSSIINRALAAANSELKRQEVSITPVDLDSDEAYAILRKRLIKQMPSENVIDAVAEAFARALTNAGAANIVTKGAEQIAKEIRSTYPFHPETKHLFAMFKDNPDFRQTRGLMELGSLLLRSVWENELDAYLVGPQHFDLAIREVGDRLAEISKLNAAIAKDIFDTSGSAAAQLIDADIGNRAASEAAALLLTSSLSTTGDANRGLRPRDAMVVLINPLGGEEDYKNAIDRLYKRAQYLHKSPEERLYFDRQVNLRALLMDMARNAPENRVNEIVSRRLKDIFEPREKSAYSEIIDGTEGIDAIIDRIKGQRVLVAVRPDGKVPPSEVQRFFESVTEKNNIFILTGERSFEANKLEDAARELYATIAAQNTIKAGNPQHQELMEYLQGAEQSLTSAIIGTYDRLFVPTQFGTNPPALRQVAIQLTGGATVGAAERVVIDALEKPPRKLFTDLTGDDFQPVRTKIEGTIWGNHDEVVYADVERRARENPGAYWLPPGGMRALKDTAVQRGVWEDAGNGRVSRTIKPKTPTVQLTVAKASTAKDHEVTLELNTVNAGNDAVLYYAENAAATRSSPRVTGGRISTSAATVGVLIVDPSRTDSADAPNASQTRWTTPLPIAHYLSDPDPDDETRTVTVYAHPQAQLRYTIDGTNPRDHGTPYEGPFKVKAARQVLNVLAAITIGDALVFENSESFGIPEAKVGPRDPWEEAAAGRRTSVQRTDGFFLINDRARVYQALDILAGGSCELFDADLRVSPTDQTGSSFHARLTGDLVMNPDVLRVLLEQAQDVIGEASANIVLRFSRAVADNHTYLRDLDALLVDHVRQGEVLQ